MKKLNFITKTIVIFSLLLVSCEGIFIPDPIDPRLPKYTEKGNNVAGALINNNIWKSIVKSSFMNVINQPIIKIYHKKDSVTIKFIGNTNEKKSYIEFHLTELKISKFEDLLKLKGQKIQLDGIKNTAYYLENNSQYTYNNKNTGQIYFKNVRIDDKTNNFLVISGTFGFSFNNTKGEKIKITFGRFDYRLENKNI